MSQPTICDLLSKYGTSDKNTFHSYGPTYDEILAPIRSTTGVILELGIGLDGGGGALRVWREYFPNAFIVGVDCNHYNLVNEDRITSILVDVFDTSALMVKLNQVIFPGSVSLVIDDGPHLADQQIRCMTSIWSLLSSGGLYVIEDAFELINGGYDKLAANRWLPKLIRIYDNRVTKDRRDDAMFWFQKD
jgi:hypothetical protein